MGLLEVFMPNDAHTDQIITTLTMQAVNQFAAGKTRAEVVQTLIQMAASQDVANAIASNAEALYVSQGGQLPA
jgi:hypothetical protein